jgi:hypothetical protein
MLMEPSSSPSDRVFLHTHEATSCAGRPCCIHNPSAHHMATWPQLWRQDRYLMERTCPHGIGHPDPDHMSYVRMVAPDYASGEGVHGCDGCCQPDPPSATLP